MAADHNDTVSIMAGIPELNASLLYANEYLDDVIGPLIDQSVANLHLTDEHLTFCEYNIEDITKTRNDTYLTLTSQLYVVCCPMFDNKCTEKIYAYIYRCFVASILYFSGTGLVYVCIRKSIE